MSAGSTTAEAFTALLAEHRVIPVIRELFADGETPVGIYREVGWKLGGWRDVGWWQRLL